MKLKNENLEVKAFVSYTTWSQFEAILRLSKVLREKCFSLKRKREKYLHSFFSEYIDINMIW